MKKLFVAHGDEPIWGEEKQCFCYAFLHSALGGTGRCEHLSRRRSLKGAELKEVEDNLPILLDRLVQAKRSDPVGLSQVLSVYRGETDLRPLARRFCFVTQASLLLHPSTGEDMGIITEIAARAVHMDIITRIMAREDATSGVALTRFIAFPGEAAREALEGLVKGSHPWLEAKHLAAFLGSKDNDIRNAAFAALSKTTRAQRNIPNG